MQFLHTHFLPKLALLAVLAAGLPSTVHADPPPWWDAEHILRLDQNNQPAAALNYGAANQGQLKNFAVGAYEYFLLTIPSELGGIGDLRVPDPNDPDDLGGTGYRLRTLIGTWVVLDADTGFVEHANLDLQGQPTGAYSIHGTGPREVTASSLIHSGYLALNQGQLKAVGSIFYDRLDEIYAPYPYPRPWGPQVGAPLNYAAANLGQLKNVFAFSLTRDSDGDGLNDLDELLHHATNGRRVPTNPFARDTDGDGIDDNLETGDPTQADNPAVGLSVFGYVAP